jgi:hypothetical protein
LASTPISSVTGSSSSFVTPTGKTFSIRTAPGRLPEALLLLPLDGPPP